MVQYGRLNALTAIQRQSLRSARQGAASKIGREGPCANVGASGCCPKKRLNGGHLRHFWALELFEKNTPSPVPWAIRSPLSRTAADGYTATSRERGRPRAAASEGRIAQRKFPTVVQATSLGDWDFDRSFEFGLSIILAGLHASTTAR